MKRKQTDSVAKFEKTCNALKNIDLGKLSLSTDVVSSLELKIATIDYYTDIYADCLERFANPQHSVLVDYGGGLAFLSYFAKAMGFAKVIYVDMNPESVRVARQLKQLLGDGPDEILCGGSDVLRQWCLQQGVKPDYLAAVDVIEHIYDLTPFFTDLKLINPTMQMAFTTASNPDNLLKVRRLRKAMLSDEVGEEQHPGFYQKRYDFIRQRFPQLSVTELQYWAKNTRGLIYSDIESAVELHRENEEVDQYNTCDPASGSWTERVLPFSDYRKILSMSDFRMTVCNGFYNTHAKGLKGKVSACLNVLLRNGGMVARFFAPFVTLDVKPQNFEQ